jgi:hypothetical protein
MFLTTFVAPDATRISENVCYEFYTKRRAVRVAWVNGQWEWTKPFEHCTQTDADAVLTECVASTTNQIFINLQPDSFRVHNDSVEKEEIQTLLPTGQVKPLSYKPQELRTDYKTICLPMNDGACGVAFCVRVYHRDGLFWQWVASAAVPWQHLKHRKQGVQTFQRSHTEFTSGNPRVFDTLILENMLTHQLPRISNFNAFSAIKEITERFVLPEYEKIKGWRASDPALEEFKIATFAIPREGLQYDAGALNPSIANLYGDSMQSWFYYDGAVPVSDKWLEQALHQVSRTHDYGEHTLSDHARALKLGKGRVDFRRLSDVIRICALHCVTRPYVPDHVVNSKGDWVESDLYSSGFVVPGDCEDGAYAAYQIYMHILFGEHPFDDLKTCAQLLGVPLGVTGTAGAPEHQGGKLASHCSCVVIPFPEFCRALGHSNWKAVFKEKYKYDPPAWLETEEMQTTKVMESVLFCMSSYKHREEEREKVIKQILLKHNERATEWKNVAYVHPNQGMSGVHRHAIRGYGNAHVLLKLKAQNVATNASCSFVFLTPENEVGVSAVDLFQSAGKFRLRVVQEMPEDLWARELSMLGELRRPIVALAHLDKDMYKSEAFESREMCDFSLADRARLGMVFVYDMDAPDVNQILWEIQGALGAKSWEKARYGWGYMIFFF